MSDRLARWPSWREQRGEYVEHVSRCGFVDGPESTHQARLVHRPDLIENDLPSSAVKVRATREG